MSFEEGGAKFPAGSWILAAPSRISTRPLRRPPQSWASTSLQVSASPDVPHHAAKPPRIGVWVPWADTDSIGWIRYSLDQRKVPYTYLRDEDIRAGNLRSRIDVLLYGHVDLELAEQIEGLPKTWSPMPFKKTAQTPSFGTPAESDDITGGIGYEGLAQIQQLRRRWRADGDARQRKHAGAGRRAGALCPPILRRRSPQHGGWRWRLISCIAASGNADAGSSRAGHFRPRRPSHLVRLSQCTLTSSGKIFRCTTSRVAGCAWLIALRASMVPKTAAAW